jgi:hypothetical protein
METNNNIGFALLPMGWTTVVRFPSAVAGNILFSTHQDQLWGPLNLVSNDTMDTEVTCLGSEADSNLQLVPRIRMCGTMPLLSVCLHVIVLN